MEKTIDRAKAAFTAFVGLLTGLWPCSSARAREGIWHKCGMIVVVLVAGGADLLISLVLDNLPMLALPVQYPGLVCPVVLVWYIVTELGSMAENAAAMGAAVPKWLMRILAMSRDAVDVVGDKLGEEDDDG